MFFRFFYFFKLNFLLFLSFLFLIFIWGLSISFSSNSIDYKVLSKFNISDIIYVDNPKLNNILLWYSINYNISNNNLFSNCNIESKFLWKDKDINYFFIKLKDNCENPKIFLKINNKILEDSYMNFKTRKENYLFELYSDKDDNTLNNFKFKLDLKLKKDYLNLSWFDNIRAKRKQEIVSYNLEVLNRILNSRKQKYEVPILWNSLPTEFSKLPNSSRTYRKKYTDWIHQWFDFDAEFLESTIAIDDGVIIRIVDNFTKNDYNKIKYADNLSYEQKLENLDILRWNQVWLKTSRWDLVFYSHLNDIKDELKLWDIVSRGQILWTVWVTWVPVDWYEDYHLHLEIHKNNYSNVSKHSFLDYMKRDWYFKGESHEYMLKHISDLFIEKK